MFPITVNQPVDIKKAFWNGHPTLVSLDFENGDSIANGFSKPNTQAGISILQTSNTTLAATKNEKITSFFSANLITGSMNYFEENKTCHMFGYAEHINKSEMTNKINQILNANCPANQPTILIAHTVSGEIKALQALGIDIKRFDYIFDTHFMAVFELDMGSLKLCELVKYCGFSARLTQFHVGSSDAALALRCFVKLILESVPEFGNKFTRQGLSDFIQFGFNPINNPPYAMIDLTTEASRKVPAKFIVNTGANIWAGKYARHLRDFIHRQDRPCGRNSTPSTFCHRTDSLPQFDEPVCVVPVFKTALSQKQRKRQAALQSQTAAATTKFSLQQSNQ